MADWNGIQIAAYAIIFISIITAFVMIYAAWAVGKLLDKKKKQDVVKSCCSAYDKKCECK